MGTKLSDHLITATLILIRSLPIGVSVFTSRLITLFYLFFRPDYRQEIEANYRAIFNRPAHRFWIRNAWTVGKNLALMAKIGTPLVTKLVDRAKIYQENYNCGERLEQKMHTIMASFHFGLWEFLPQVYSALGFDVGLMLSTQRSPALDRRLRLLREQGGVQLLYSLRALLKRIRGPGITGFMLDNTSRGSTRQVFLKTTERGLLGLRLPGLAFRIAAKSGTRVVPLFCYLSRGRLIVRIFPEGDEQDCARALLKMVNSNPSEWIFWAKSGALARLKPCPTVGQTFRFASRSNAPISR